LSWISSDVFITTDKTEKPEELEELVEEQFEQQIEHLEGNMVSLGGKQLPIGKSYRDTVLKVVFDK